MYNTFIHVLFIYIYFLIIKIIIIYKYFACSSFSLVFLAL